MLRAWFLAVLCVVAFAWPAGAAPPVDLNRDLAGWWPLAGDLRDHSGAGRDAQQRGPVALDVSGPRDNKRSAAGFNGRDTWLEVAPAAGLKFGAGDFSVTLWAHLESALDDVPGDLISQFDTRAQRGWQLAIKTNAGVASTQANYRQLQWSIDNNRTTDWSDCGRPGEALLAFALVSHEGQLYAGTCEPAAGASGRVYRFESPNRWIDCGAPTTANAVTAMAVCDGKLYAGTGKYRLGGSAMKESENAQLGGRIMRYDGGKTWTDCGQLPAVEAVGGLVVFRGKLYASSLYKPAGFFRYDGGTNWTDCGTPGKRVEALGVYNGHLYATSYDGGHVFRYDGTSWTDCGQLGDAENTQTYSFAVFEGRLFVGTWRTGRVYRFEDVGRWTDVGRLGEELEVMGMLAHNGRLIAGTLPLAEVYQYTGDAQWSKLTRLDLTPDVTYRRAWTMAEHRGRLFVSTLPSGHVHAYQAGQTATHEVEFPAGWHHVAAVRAGGALKLYVDGKLVDTSATFNAADYDLDTQTPLWIGRGTNDYFQGRLSDVRVYRRALASDEIEGLASPTQAGQ